MVVKYSLFVIIWLSSRLKNKGHMKLRNILLLVVVLLFASCSTKKVVQQSQYPKREFRGAWIQAVNGQFSGMGEVQMKKYLTEMLDNLEKVNVNAILFQVRVEGDALYPSDIEPWSRFLTGVQGRSPGWDPLAFMVSECHKRNMELHAWINPYRARTKGTKFVAPEHQSVRNPGDFVEFEGQLYFNPALQSNRDHICKVVTDIITRYDVDGLHIDDYFYPYPVKGKEFNDDRQFPKQGYGSKGDWRRENVNHLIYQLHRTVRELKPWVKFGVSPFGIYRNQASDPAGSKTKGLQCYDALSVSASGTAMFGRTSRLGATRSTLARRSACSRRIACQPMSNSQRRIEKRAELGKAWWLLCSSSPPIQNAHGVRLVEVSADSKLR